MTERIFRPIAPLAAGALWALPALAADEHGHGTVEAAGEVAHDAAAHGSPNLFSVEPGLMIWTAVTFLVVLVVLRLTAWGPIMKSLGERQAAIEGAIEEARKTRAEAEALLAKYETMLESAKDEAAAILEEARKDGLRTQEQIRDRAHHEAEEFKARAHREIDLAKDNALKEIWDLAAGLSTELANRILGRTVVESDQDRLVRELVDEMRGELAGGDGRPGTGRG